MSVVELSDGCPAFHFIAAKGGRVFTCVGLWIILRRGWSGSADPVEIDFLILGVWLTA